MGRPPPSPSSGRPFAFPFSRPLVGRRGVLCSTRVPFFALRTCRACNMISRFALFGGTNPLSPPHEISGVGWEAVFDIGEEMVGVCPPVVTPTPSGCVVNASSFILPLSLSRTNLSPFSQEGRWGEVAHHRGHHLPFPSLSPFVAFGISSAQPGRSFPQHACSLFPLSVRAASNVLSRFALFALAAIRRSAGKPASPPPPPHMILAVWDGRLSSERKCLPASCCHPIHLAALLKRAQCSPPCPLCTSFPGSSGGAMGRGPPPTHTHTHTHTSSGRPFAFPFSLFSSFLAFGGFFRLFPPSLSLFLFFFLVLLPFSFSFFLLLFLAPSLSFSFSFFLFLVLLSFSLLSFSFFLCSLSFFLSL